MSLASPCRPELPSIRRLRRFIFETECATFKQWWCSSACADCCHFTCLLPPVIKDSLVKHEEIQGKVFILLFTFSQDVDSDEVFKRLFLYSLKNSFLRWWQTYFQLPCNQIIWTHFHLKLLLKILIEAELAEVSHAAVTFTSLCSGPFDCNCSTKNVLD